MIFNEHKKGATSVLVVFVMIVFVTIGAFSILSANVNLNFSRKVEEWNKDYYLLEEETERFIADLDEILLKSEMETGNGLIYEQTVQNNLDALKQIYPELIIGDDLMLHIDFNSETNEEMMMSLKLKILMTEEKLYTGKRFSIEEKREWQDYTGKEDNVTVWDGNIF